MQTSVHSVLIGKQAPASYTAVDALAVGDVALFDENKALIKTAADAVNANSLYVGVAGEKMNVTMPDGTVAQKANIDFSTEIQKASKPSAVIGKYVAPVEEKIVITLTNATIIAGNRYVLRIVYKDMYEAAWQFTHTYEVCAETTTPADLVNALLKKINAHKNRRVQASTSAAVLTLTAMPKDDNEGVYSLNEYSVVSMEASLYETIPGALLANQPKAVVGATIVKTAGNPGKGYWIRKVVEDAEYDYAIIENDNLYLSNDNQYIKTTPLTTEVYCPNLVDSIVDKGIQSFIAGKTIA